jgi:hypothetical protein
MPIVKPHPQIPGAFVAEATASEPTPSGSINVSVLLDKTRVRGTVAQPTTIQATVVTNVPVVSISPVIAPGDTEITTNTVAGSGTTWTFNIAVAKTGTSEYSRSVVVTVTDVNGKTSSGQAFFVVDLLPSSVPSGVTATGLSKAIEIKWNAVNDSDLKEYRVYYNTAATPTDGSVKTLLGTSTGTIFTHTGLSEGTQRWYWVTSVDTAGNESAVSTQATAVAQGDIRMEMKLLTTRVSASGTIQGTIYSDSTINGSWLTLSCVPANAGITFSAVTPSGVGQTFAFTVTVNVGNIGSGTFAVVAALDTALSNGKSGFASDSFVVDTVGPSAVQSLAVDPRIGAVRLTWAPNAADTDIAYYLIYRGTSSTQIGKTVDTQFLDSRDTTASSSYWVRAVDTVGNLGTLTGPITGAPKQIIDTDIQLSAIQLGSLSGRLAENRTTVSWAVVSAGAFAGNTTTKVVSWTGLVINDRGVTYTITNGSSANELIWWRRGETVLRADTRTTFESTFNETLGDKLLVVHLRDGAGAATGTYYQTWDSTVVRAAQVFTDAIETRHIKTDAITAGEIAADAVLARNVAAGSITATKLAIVNAAYDPGKFAAGSTAGNIKWTALQVVANGVTYPSTSTTFDSAAAGVSGYYVWLDRSTNTIQVSGTPTSGFTGFGFDALDGDVLLGFNNAGTYVPNWAGTVIRGDLIQTGTVEARHVKVATLEALSANLGTVLTGRIQDVADPTLSKRGIRIASSYVDPISGLTVNYGRPTGWGASDSFYIDLAASGTENFIQAGVGFSVDATGTAAFAGSVTASSMLVTNATTIKGTAEVFSTLGTRGLIVQAASGNGGFQDRSFSRFSFGEDPSGTGFNHYFAPRKFTSTKGASNTNSTTLLWDTARSFVPGALANNDTYIYFPNHPTDGEKLITANTATSVTFQAVSFTPVDGEPYEIRNMTQARFGSYTVAGSGGNTTYIFGSGGSGTWTNPSVNINQWFRGTYTGATQTATNITSIGTKSAGNLYTLNANLNLDASTYKVIGGSAQLTGIAEIWLTIDGTRQTTPYDTLSVSVGWSDPSGSGTVGGTNGTKSSNLSKNIVVSFTTSLTIELIPKLTIAYTGNIQTGGGVNGSVSFSSNAQSITWQATSGTGSASRQTLRLYASEATTTQGFSPHLVLEPIAAVPSSGKAGDLINAGGILYVHDGTNWVAAGTGSTAGAVDWVNVTNKPAALAFTNLAQSWTALQTFTTGLTVSGGTITLPANSLAKTALPTATAFKDAINVFSAQQTIERTNTTDVALITRIPANTSNADFALYIGGKMEWGAANAVRDTNLYRGAAAQLKTDNNFVAATLTATSTTAPSLFPLVTEYGPTTIANTLRGRPSLLWAALAGSRPIYFDEEFVNGNGSVVAYNNGTAGTVVVTRVADATAPNRSGQVMQIVTDTSLVAGGTVSPNFGGFQPSPTLTSRINATFVQRFRAKIPVGYSLNIASNAIGTNGQAYWITSTAGTGKWEDYIKVIHSGDSGTFSTTGHTSLSGPSQPVTWYLASHNIYELDAPGTTYIQDAALSSNIPLKNAVNVFTDVQTVERANLTDAALTTRLPANTSNADFALTISGRMEWGANNATRDTTLYRSAANTLKTDDNLVVALQATAATVQADAVLFKTSANAQLGSTTYLSLDDLPNGIINGNGELGTNGWATYGTNAPTLAAGTISDMGMGLLTTWPSNVTLADEAGILSATTASVAGNAAGFWTTTTCTVRLVAVWVTTPSVASWIVEQWDTGTGTWVPAKEVDGVSDFAPRSALPSGSQVAQFKGRVAGATNYHRIRLFIPAGTVLSAGTFQARVRVTFSYGTQALFPDYRLSMRSLLLDPLTIAGAKTFSSQTSFSNGISLTAGTSTQNIAFTGAGLAPPAFNSRSTGTKVVLWPGLSATSADYGLGIETGVVWFSVPQNNTSFGYKWYGGTTQAMKLLGDGALTVANGVTISAGGAAITGNSTVTGTLGVTSTGTFGAAKSQIGGDATHGSIELGDSTAASGTVQPYIDFHHAVGGAQDFNARLVNDANTRLSASFAGGSGTFRINGLLDIASQSRGDLLYYNGTTYARRAIGAGGYVLTSDGVDPQWKPSITTVGAGDVRSGAHSSGTTIMYVDTLGVPTTGTGAAPTIVPTVTPGYRSMLVDLSAITLPAGNQYVVYFRVADNAALTTNMLEYELFRGTGTKFTHARLIISPSVKFYGYAVAFAGTPLVNGAGTVSAKTAFSAGQSALTTADVAAYSLVTAAQIATDTLSALVANLGTIGSGLLVNRLPSAAGVTPVVKPSAAIRLDAGYTKPGVNGTLDLSGVNFYLDLAADPLTGEEFFKADKAVVVYANGQANFEGEVTAGSLRTRREVVVGLDAPTTAQLNADVTGRSLILQSDSKWNDSTVSKLVFQRQNLVVYGDAIQGTTNGAMSNVLVNGVLGTKVPVEATRNWVSDQFYNGGSSAQILDAQGVVIAETPILSNDRQSFTMRGSWNYISGTTYRIVNVQSATLGTYTLPAGDAVTQSIGTWSPATSFSTNLAGVGTANSASYTIDLNPNPGTSPTLPATGGEVTAEFTLRLDSRSVDFITTGSNSFATDTATVTLYVYNGVSWVQGPSRSLSNAIYQGSTGDSSLNQGPVTFVVPVSVGSGTTAQLKAILTLNRQSTVKTTGNTTASVVLNPVRWTKVGSTDATRRTLRLFAQDNTATFSPALALEPLERLPATGRRGDMVYVHDTTVSGNAGLALYFHDGGGWQSTRPGTPLTHGRNAHDHSIVRVFTTIQEGQITPAPSSGDFWFNSDTHRFRGHNGTAVQDLVYLADIYTQTQLQTSGQAVVHAGNLTGTIASANISGNYANLTGVGTLTSGVWNASIIGLSKGGTGVDNSTGRSPNTVFAGPGSGSGAASFRALVVADIPVIDIGTQTTGTLTMTRGGTGLSTVAVGALLHASAANTWAALGGNTTTTRQFLSSTGTGTVANAPSWGTIGFTDLTGSLTNSQIAGSYTGITGVGTLTAGTWNATPIGTSFGGTGVSSVAANLVFVGPGTGVPAAPTFRALASADIPNIDGAKITTGTVVVGVGGTGKTSWTANGVVYASATTTLAQVALNTTATAMYLKQTSSGSPAFAQVGFADLSGTVSNAQAASITALGTLTGLTSSGNVTIAGSSLNINRPVTAGAWARGITYQMEDGTTVLGGVGILGSSTTVTNIYMAHGTSPWASALGIYILPDGKVGVGKVAPTAALDVTGAITTSAGGTFNGNVAVNANLTFSATGQLNLGTSTRGTAAPLSVIYNGDGIEFGHSNAVGFRGTIGADPTNGANYLIFHGAHGAGTEQYSTFGNRATILRADTTGGLTIANVAGSNLANQTRTDRFTFANNGDLTVTGRYVFSDAVTNFTLSSTGNVALLNAGAAARLYTGGLLASDAYSDATLIPANGVYSKGTIKGSLTDMGSGFNLNGSPFARFSGNYTVLYEYLNGTANTLLSQGDNQYRSGSHLLQNAAGTATYATFANDYVHLFRPILFEGGFAIEMNRANGAVGSLSFYSAAYNTWRMFMTPAGGATPEGGVAPTGTLVTSWGLRSVIEAQAGYGWTFETAAINGSGKAIAVEIRYDGAAKFAGAVTASDFVLA